MASFRGYQPDPAGLRDLGQEAALGDACLRAARAGLAFAQADDPDGTYQVRSETVPGGYNNEPRAGAVLEEVEPSGEERHTLVRAVPIIEAS